MKSVKEILKGRSRKTLAIGAAAVCMVLAGTAVYATNAGSSADNVISGANTAANGTQAYDQAYDADDSGAAAIQEAAAAGSSGEGNVAHHYAEHQIPAANGGQAVEAAYGSGGKAGTAADIGLEKAKSIALGKVSGADAGNIVKAERDYDDGILEYEIEIVYNGYEYDFEINGSSGSIISHETERHEYWD